MRLAKLGFFLFATVVFAPRDSRADTVTYPIPIVQTSQELCHQFASGATMLRRDGESAGWPRRARHVEESRDSTGQGAGESQVGAT